MLQICACGPALKALLNFSHVDTGPSGELNSFHASRHETDPEAQSSASHRRRVFSLNKSLPWSSQSRSQKGSVPLRDHRLPEEGSWQDTSKTQAEVQCESALHDSDENNSPVLRIMRRQSVEIVSLHSARTASTVSHHMPQKVSTEQMMQRDIDEND